MRYPILIVLSFVLAVGAVNAQSKKLVLFVCEHGAARSVIAASYFNKIAKEKGLGYEAQFRGTDPQDSLTIGTKRGLTKDGFSTDRMKPQLVAREDVTRADIVVTFDCSVPNTQPSKAVLRWDGIPPISESYDSARNQIVSRVRALVDQLLIK